MPLLRLYQSAAALLHLSVAAHQLPLALQITTPNQPQAICRSQRLRTKEADGTCIFLTQSRRCSIHAARPTQCATYPFWPRALWSSIDWQAEAAVCEGINLLPVHAAPSQNDGAKAGGSSTTDVLAADSGQSSLQHAVLNQTLDSQRDTEPPALAVSAETFSQPHAGSPEAEAHAAQEQVLKAFVMHEAQASMGQTREVLEGLLTESMDEESIYETAVSLQQECREVVWQDARFAVVDTHLAEDSWQRCESGAAVQLLARLPSLR